jgi:hypothetical protein
MKEVNKRLDAYIEGIKNSKEFDGFAFPEILKGVRAGGIEAIRQAYQKGTHLVISRDGKIAEITPDEAEAMIKERSEKKEQQ